MRDIYSIWYNGKQMGEKSRKGCKTIAYSSSMKCHKNTRRFAKQKHEKADELEIPYVSNKLYHSVLINIYLIIFVTPPTSIPASHLFTFSL